MALIENLERDGWEEFLRDSFRYALEVLKEGRFRAVGSSVDDLRSWLTVGGVARVIKHLDRQMDMRQFSSTRKEEVKHCLEQLVQENRSSLLGLMVDGIIPATGQEWHEAWGMSEPDAQDLLDRIVAGERPFEEWMHAHGHSDEEIAEVYRAIDQWLIQQGIISSLPPSQNLH